MKSETDHLRKIFWTTSQTLRERLFTDFSFSDFFIRSDLDHFESIVEIKRTTTGSAECGVMVDDTWFAHSSTRTSLPDGSYSLFGLWVSQDEWFALVGFSAEEITLHLLKWGRCE